MPTSNNITVSPGTGTGTTSLTIQGTQHTGRNNRTASFSLAGTGSYSDRQSTNSLVVTQDGVGEQFLLTTSASTSAFPAAGGTITYSGSSNLAYLVLGTDTLDELLTSATVNNTSVTKSQLQSGYSVPGDPGKASEYTVTLVFTIPENTDTSHARTYSGSMAWQEFEVTQSAASNTLSFSRSSVTVNANGSISGDPVSVIAPNGLTWEISEDE